jgi:hypothetical protein
MYPVNKRQVGYQTAFAGKPRAYKSKSKKRHRNGYT